MKKTLEKAGTFNRVSYTSVLLEFESIPSGFIIINYYFSYQQGMGEGGGVTFTLGSP